MRYKLLGARYVYQAQFVAFRWRYRRLSTSQHPAAFMARTALAHGLCLDAEGDVLTDDLYTSSPDFDALDRFLGSSRGAGAPARQILPLLDGARSAVFERFSRLGLDVRRTGQSGAFREYHRVLDAVDHPNGWAARVALAHGLFIEPARISADYARIQHFLPPAPGFVGPEVPREKRPHGAARSGHGVLRDSCRTHYRCVGEDQDDPCRRLPFVAASGG